MSLDDDNDDDDENDDNVASEQVGSRLFVPYRSLGVISSGAPFCVLQHHSSLDASLVLPIRERFHVMQCDRLHPVLVSQTVPGVGHEIHHVQADSVRTVVSHGKQGTATHLTLYRRAKPIFTVQPMKDYCIVNLVNLGQTKRKMTGQKEGKHENALLLAAIMSKQPQDDDDNAVIIVGDDNDNDDHDNDAQCWVVLVLVTREDCRVQKRMSFPLQRPNVAMHPATYLNKLLLGGNGLVLVNLRAGKVVHTFDCDHVVTALEQSPAVDTVAVGTRSGRVQLLNLRHDQILFCLDHQGSAIVSMSFRTDAAATHFAVGRRDGTVSVWDLSERTLVCDMQNVHPGGVSRLVYLSQEPLLVSTGTRSNSVLMHVFENQTGRLLRSRKGHTSLPPTTIGYLHRGDANDASSCTILSGGTTLREFSSARFVLEREYSPMGPSLPPVLAMAWARGNLVTIHRHHAFSYVWSIERGAQSGPVLRQDDWRMSGMLPQPTHATAVTISACGNFAIVGTQGGHIYKYNTQSGIPRGTYPPTTTTSAKKKRLEPGSVARTMREWNKVVVKADLDAQEADGLEQARVEQTRRVKLREACHYGAAVTGLAVDECNRTLLSVGADSKLVLWNFATHGPKRPVLLEGPVRKLVRDSDLAALCLDQGPVLLFDCATRRIVRRFSARDPTDVAFHAKTLCVCDHGTVRVWDVLTGACLDWMSFRTPCTSLTITEEFLATTHANRLGISMWSNKSYYRRSGYTDPPTQPIPMDAPIKQTQTQPQPTIVEEEEESLVPKEKGLITLSGLPPAHWKNLFHLELIKERNKPREPPKKPPSAPFFLQWRQGENVVPKDDDDEWAAVWDDDDNDDDDANETSVVKRRQHQEEEEDGAKKRQKVYHRSHLAALLEEGKKDGTFLRVTEYMGTLGPSAMDVELSTLCRGSHDTGLLHVAALWLLEACKSRERFEAVHAYLHRFLHLHGSVLAELQDSETIQTIGALRREQAAATEKLQARMQHTLCLLRHFTRMI